MIANFFTVFLTIKNSPQYISITLLQIPLRLYEHRGSYWRKKPPWTILEEQFRVPVPRTTAASKVGDHNKFPSLSNTTVVAIFQICVYGDIVYSQTWEVLTLKRLYRTTLNDYYSMAASFVTKLNFWRRKRYRIRLDSFLYLSWFMATINTTVCSPSLFSTYLERHEYELDPVHVMFLNCLCSSIFLENSRGSKL